METIDQYHKNQMDYFQQIKNVIIPNFQKERELLKNKLIVENNLEERLLIIDQSFPFILIIDYYLYKYIL